MKRLYATLATLFIVLLLLFVWWTNGTSAADPNDRTPKIFTIQPGAGVRAIAKNLKDQGLIKDPVVFFLLTKRLGIDQRIQAGDYRLFASWDANQIAKELTHGTLDIWVTVPEGQRADEIADTLEQKMPKYDKSWRKVLDQNEGYLFPDTYLFPKDATAETIVSIMTKNFDTKYNSLNTSKTQYGKEQIVTIASLIEREARHSVDRPLVASVIYNRLGLGMKLDLDATVQYALGYQKDQKRWWKNGLSNYDLSIGSDYNTYANAGLPPSPIANPGLASLQAALNPASTDYLYYITDKNGNNRYATTFEEHQANIQKYGL